MKGRLVMAGMALLVVAAGLYLLDGFLTGSTRGESGWAMTLAAVAALAGAGVLIGGLVWPRRRR